MGGIELLRLTLDTATKDEIRELSSQGRIKPEGVLTLMGERGFPTGGISRNDVAIWLQWEKTNE